MAKPHSNSGARLQRLWGIPAEQVRYHCEGRFYMPLGRFPGALCDPNGYVLFPTPADYAACARLSVGARLNVRGRLADRPNYISAPA